jgi:hypothetical protein
MNTTAFLDELEKIAQEKVAIDPASIAAFIAGAKASSLVTNIVRAHGLKIPLLNRVIKRVGAEAIGFGARQGAMGYPLLSRPTREAVRLLEPSLVKAYEAGHAIGKGLGPQGLLKAKTVTGRLQAELGKRNPALAKELKGFADVIEKARVGPTSADILFAPVGEAVKTLKEVRPSPISMRRALKADRASGAHVMFPSEVITARETAKRIPSGIHS